MLEGYSRQVEQGVIAMLVKLSDAAWLVSRHERIVRRRLLIPEGEPGHLPARKQGSAWLIDTADLARYWSIDAGRLDELQRRERRSPDVMAAKIAEMERELKALRARVSSLEAQNGRQTRQDDQQAAWGSPDMSSISPPAYKPSGELLARSFSMTYAPSIAGATFRTRSDAARWLMRHGISENTPKSWPGWRDVELEPRAVLQLALSLYDPSNWRITWRLHPCDDSACVCHELLGGLNHD